MPSMGVGRGGQGGTKGSLDLEIWHFAFKVLVEKYFLVSELVKWNFTTVRSPWKKSFRNPWCRDRHVFIETRLHAGSGPLPRECSSSKTCPVNLSWVFLVHGRATGIEIYLFGEASQRFRSLQILQLHVFISLASRRQTGENSWNEKEWKYGKNTVWS